MAKNGKFTLFIFITIFLNLNAMYNIMNERTLQSHVTVGTSFSHFHPFYRENNVKSLYTKFCAWAQ